MSTVGIVALGTTQVTAQPIWANSFYNQVSTCTSAAFGVCLPGAVTGQTLGNSTNNVVEYQYTIANDGVSALSVFPPTGAQIDALGSNNAFNLAAGESAIFFIRSATQIDNIGLSGSGGLPISAAGTANLLVQATALATPVNQIYTLIGTCTNTNNSVALPTTAPLLNQPYYYRNNGANTAQIWPGVTSALNSTIDALGANIPFLLGSNASVSFVAVSNAAGLVTWFSSGYYGPRPVVTMLAAATALVMGPQHIGCMVTSPANTSGAGVAVTLPAGVPGGYIDFIPTGTLGQIFTFTPAAGSIIMCAAEGAGTGATNGSSAVGLASSTTAAATMVVGDWAQFHYNGIFWSCRGGSKATAGLA